MAPRVLVAEDDPELLDTIAEVFDRFGAEVVRADSGAELVMRIVESGPFDLVITDVSMPWASGLEVMGSARFAGVSAPIVIITALMDPTLPERVRELGGEAVLLRKPFDLEELESIAVRLIGR
jgi:CheY-like chemotaxis protein